MVCLFSPGFTGKKSSSKASGFEGGVGSKVGDDGDDPFVVGDVAD
jgi:hypothetical protein